MIKIKYICKKQKNMKKLFTLLLVTTICLSTSAQSNSLTAGIGLLNTKVRVQLEHGFADKMTTGANLSYYLVNWKGPRLEGFYRLYFSDDSDIGAFFQTKAGFGLFSNVLDGELTTFELGGETYDIFEKSTFTTVGGGIGFGYKYTANGGFVFETTLGYAFWSPPSDNYTDEYQAYSELGYAFETIGYYLVGPGFPLDFQLKFGYSF
jgi:hypothetical protein